MVTSVTPAMPYAEDPVSNVLKWILLAVAVVQLRAVRLGDGAHL